MKKVFALIVFSALAASMFFFVLARGQGQSEEQSPQAEVKHAIHHDVSPPLRDIQSLPRAEAQRERPLRSIPNGPFQNQEDPAVQANVGPLVGTTPGLNFAGVGEGDYGISTIFAPSDANVAVGDTQVVQWVNGPFLDIGVFDKTTGAIAPGFPKAGNSLWSKFGGGCETNDDGDPIVQYDKANNRWVMTQFSVSTTPYLQCVAVSTTSDVTGTYNRYSFDYGNQFPDYLNSESGRTLITYRSTSSPLVLWAQKYVPMIASRCAVVHQRRRYVSS